MNIASLISAAPDVLSGLQDMGFSDQNINDFAGEIGNQLGGSDGLDLTDLLTGLSVGSFVKKLDIDEIAERTLISPELANKAIALIAPLIGEFGGGSKVRGLGGLMKKFFK